jgi:hypothetical protein
MLEDRLQARWKYIKYIKIPHLGIGQILRPQILDYF